MILTKLYIENFGKLHQKTIYFNCGLNELCYENGYGKTTLSIFIKSMFYGMPASRENIKMERKKYMPWQGGNFGGFLEFEYNKTHYRITRYFGKTPESDTIELLNLSTNTIIDLKGKELGEAIFNVGRDTFEMTAFFPQLNFSISTNQQISANILGLDKFKYDLANLNDAITQIKKKITEVKRNKITKSELENIKNSIQELKLELNSLKSQAKEIDEKIFATNNKINEIEKIFAEEKQKIEFQSQKYLEKQKLEEKLSSLQNDLNVLLTEQNAILPEKNNKFKQILQISLITAGCLGLLAAIFLAVTNLLGIVAWLVVGGISILCFITVIVLFFFKKRENDTSQNVVKNNILLCNQEILIVKNSLSFYSDIINPNYSSLENINNNLTQQKLLYNNLLHEKESFIQRVDCLIEKIDSLNVEYNKKEEIMISVNKKIELLTMTKNYLEQANENVSNRYVRPANLAINKILSKFNVRDREFVVDSNFDIKEITTNGAKEEEYSSQGYRDILAFCVRVYLLKEIYKNEKPFIILDDTFVNLDDDNMEKARQVLKELEKEYQIIYSCCHSRCKIK